MKLLWRTAEWISVQFITAQFGYNRIEKLPLSATCFDTERSGMRKHYVFEKAESFTLPYGRPRQTTLMRARKPGVLRHSSSQ